MMTSQNLSQQAHLANLANARNYNSNNFPKDNIPVASIDAFPQTLPPCYLTQPRYSIAYPYVIPIPGSNSHSTKLILIQLSPRTPHSHRSGTQAPTHSQTPSSAARGITHASTKKAPCFIPHRQASIIKTHIQDPR